MNIIEKIESSNIADDLDEGELRKIAGKVVEEYELDEMSRVDWLNNQEEAMKIAMQVEEVKTTPWRGAANVKFPLLTTACVQFSARALPSIIKGSDVIKGRVTGADPDGKKAARARRISDFMSYQLLEEMTEWEEDNDKMFTSLPITGCMFRKTYYDPILETNVSERIFPKDLVIHYNTKSMAKAERITHLIELSPNEIEERKRAGMYCEEDYIRSGTDDGRDNDDDAPHLFLEQHRLLDLDDDGYKEPYIVTVHKDTRKVARIIARFDRDGIVKRKERILRIEPIEYFTKYPFMPSPDGSIYDVGFGALMAPINKTVNQTINQLLDSGTLQNMQGGFLGRGVSLGKHKSSGDLKFSPGEWKKLNVTGDDLRKGVFPLPTKEPSNVLFSLLGLMVDSAEKMTSVADVLTGESPGQEVPATTTLALIEQGLKVFNAIFKRIHKSLGAEYKKVARLNKKHLPAYKYYIVNDDVKVIPRQDFDDSDCDVQPVSDPAEATHTQRLIKGEALMSRLGQGFNDNEIRRRWVEAMDYPDAEKILKDDKGQPIKPPQDPKIMLEQQKTQMDMQESQRTAQLEQQKIKLEALKLEGELQESRTKCVLNIAKAEAAESGQQLEKYKAELKSLDERFKVLNDARLASTQSNTGQNQRDRAGNR